ncbi:MAG: MFS transporter, partial [Stackebrandtia sp.]
MSDDPDLDERQATYREVFATGEVRALMGSFAISRASGMLARVAVTFLVWNSTGSTLLSAGAFAITYAPYLGPAQLLATLADRLPYRTTMIVADFLRMILIGLVAIPGMPLPVMLTLMFGVALVEPAYQSSRSALFPKLLFGDALTLGLSVYMTINQTAQLTGYVLGGVLAGLNPHLALAINSACFGISGLLLIAFVSHRPAEKNGKERKNLFRETGEGFALVFGNRVLRMIAFVVFTVVGFTIVTEGAAAAWSDHLGGGALLQGLIMGTAPAATIVATIVFTRFVRPGLRQKLLRPMVLIAPLALTTALLDPVWGAVLGIAAVAKLSSAVLAPLNATFVKAVPDGYRARAFSVMQSGMSLVQGLAVVSIGALAESSLSVPQSVGLWGVAGVILVGLLLAFWPSSAEFAAAAPRAERPAIEPPPSEWPLRETPMTPAPVNSAA